MLARLFSSIEGGAISNISLLTSLRSISSSSLSQSLRDALPPSLPRGSLPGAEKPDLVTKFLSLDNSSQDEQLKAKLTAITKEFQRFDGDVGSTEVQVARLTEQIKYLAEHLKIHKKDHSTRRGLQAMLARRRKLLQYFRRSSFDSYAVLISRLGLKDTSYAPQDRFTRRYKQAS